MKKMECGDSWIRPADSASGPESQGGRAVAGPAGIRDLAAAERAVDDQADLLGDRLLAGLGQQAEPEAANLGERLAGARGDRTMELGTGHGVTPSLAWPGAPHSRCVPARGQRAPGGGTAGPGIAGWWGRI